ncbi:hypothetical protein CNEO_42077 [Clostridium neonatale]|uniref:Uncharacterized protein n=1 Tax=Clostridium neonatale TaxID=137838 RepID=A0AA86JET7_9CLOT|nr:hypothetical protein CNEO_42077 [Clostridium neonatale]
MFFILQKFKKRGKKLCIIKKYLKSILNRRGKNMKLVQQLILI